MTTWEEERRATVEFYARERDRAARISEEALAEVERRATESLKNVDLKWGK